MTTITDATTAVPTPTPPAATTASSNGLSSDFDTFLTLLTAQIRNQDPLEPSDSTEFVAQLATFSNVEQSVRTNELLEGMAARLDQQDVSSAAEWIGMDVRHSGSIAGDAAAQDLYVTIPAVADRADLVVTDALGREVRRQAVSPDARTLAWPGPAGPLPAGQYTLQVEAQAGDQPLTPVPVSHYGTVGEVALTEAGPELILTDGTRLPTDQLEAVRAPR
ncbi:MAG: flagellar hook capping FlgD N-terminal domain-containing protein [Pseudomonadota bacterium]